MIEQKRSRNYLFETTRCLLREMDEGDAEAVLRLNLHPDVFLFTTDPPFKNVEEAITFIRNYDEYRKHGLGRWAVELKKSGAFIGWCGLRYLPEEEETDIGYRFLPEYWGQGYAVETALRCIQYGFEMGLKRIVARVHKENLRSIRVSEKLNMVYERDLLYDGVPWMNFVIEK